jgi:hypothetical protein
MIAEYWMEDTGNTGSTGGAGSSQILDRWTVIAQYVMRRDIYDLEHAVKLFFILNNTLLDACIACWDTKYAYASVRPITAIHKIYAGRSVQAWAGPYKGPQQPPSSVSIAGATTSAAHIPVRLVAQRSNLTRHPATMSHSTGRPLALPLSKLVSPVAMEVSILSRATWSVAFWAGQSPA